MPKSTVLSFPSVTIGSVSTDRLTLLKAFDSADPVVVDVSATETIDLAGFQLLVALVKEGIKRGVPVTLTGQLPVSLQEKIKKVGLSDTDCTSGEDLYEQVSLDL